MVSVAVATPLASVQRGGEELRLLRCGTRRAGVSKVILTLRTGLPSSSRTTAVITDEPGWLSVTTTLRRVGDGDQVADQAGQGDRAQRGDDARLDLHLQVGAGLVVREGQAGGGVAGLRRSTGMPVCCCELASTSQGGSALVTGKPTMPMRCDDVVVGCRTGRR